MPDLGIGETLAALGASGAGGLGSLLGGLFAPAAGAAEVGAAAAPELITGAELGALPVAAEAAGAGAGASSLGGSLAAGAGADLAGLGTGIFGDVATSLAGGDTGPLLPTPTGSPDLTPAARVAQGFSTLPTPTAPAAPTPGGGLGASGIAAPSGDFTGGGFANIGPDTTISLTDQAASGVPVTGTTTPQSGGGLLNFIKNNPGLAATLGIGAAGTLASGKLAPLIAGKVPQQPGLEALLAQERGLAGTQQQLGTTLTDPLVTGKLPSGAEQSVTNAINDAITTTKARYANLGLSGSTMEADAVANIQNQATAIRFKIAQEMAQTGIQATSQAAGAMGLQDTIYTQLMNAQISQDQALQQAIARFAGAAALGSGAAASRG